ncbi:hypothetical protein CTheo_7900 [Ceratobasidium theobromae]|uniref:Ricin B lectin domain-containing protein n=1 Tax=Ceratobasidium theobromae TaxID=1582974 RepID=A0A5N5QA64_9AGAM|nr:hypothetical protein CTheo_7900 [Ceratobasidium theobromae]
MFRSLVPLLPLAGLLVGARPTLAENGLSAGVYKITQPGRFLSVRNPDPSKDLEGELEMLPPDDTSNQLWSIEQQPDGTFTLQNKALGCFAIRDPRGPTLELYTLLFCSQSEREYFSFDPSLGGTYQTPDKLQILHTGIVSPSHVSFVTNAPNPLTYYEFQYVSSE